MKSSSASKIKIAGFDDLFGENIDKADKVINMPISELHAFKNHPFHVEDDQKMKEMIESIKEYGVLVPGLARSRKEGGYELISGHRRKHACEVVGKETMPIIIKELSDDEATITMVDANIQRENLLYSERAFAFKLKFDAMKHQGSKGNKTSTDKIGEESGESGRQIQRYIRLTCLLPEILKLVDNKNIAFIPAVNISYLDVTQQEWVLNAIQVTHNYPSNQQTMKIRKCSDEGKLTQNIVILIIKEQKVKDIKITISATNCKKYFPDECSAKEIEKIIYKLLENWKQTNQ